MLRIHWISSKESLAQSSQSRFLSGASGPLSSEKPSEAYPTEVEEPELGYPSSVPC